MTCAIPYPFGILKAAKYMLVLTLNAVPKKLPRMVSSGEFGLEAGDWVGSPKRTHKQHTVVDYKKRS